MKILMALISTLLIGAPVLACPQISGSYTCTDQVSGEQGRIDIMQKNIDGVEYYSGIALIEDPEAATEYFPADGVLYEVEGAEESYISTSCPDAESVSFNLITPLEDSEFAIAYSSFLRKISTSDLSAAIVISLNKDGNSLETEGAAFSCTKGELL